MKKMVICVVGLMTLMIAAGYWFFLQPGAKTPQAGQAVKSVKQAQPELEQTVNRTVAGIPVLMYHSIGDEPNNDAVITKELFTAHMEYLHQQGFTPLTLEELESYLSGKLQPPAKPVVITFDDGYRDTYEVAMPILKRFGFRSTMFIPVGEVGQRLSWKELREMKAAGMQIASHSFTHRELAGMTVKEQSEEIRRSKELLDKFLEQDTRFFCFPNGSYNQDTLKLLKQYGFTLAVTIEPGWAKRGDDPLTLQRVWMGNSVTQQHLYERLTRTDYPII